MTSHTTAFAHRFSYLPISVRVPLPLPSVLDDDLQVLCNTCER